MFFNSLIPKTTHVQWLTCRFLSQLSTESVSNKNEKLVKLAIIGVPNAGKSTFINNFVNHRVSHHESFFSIL